MNITKHPALNLLIALISILSLPTNACFANAVPVSTKEVAISSSQKNRLEKKIFLHKKQKKAHRTKKYLKQQEGKDVHWLIWSGILWYGIILGLLITGIILAIPPLWITALVLMLLPIALALIFWIVFIILLLTTPWG